MSPGVNDHYRNTGALPKSNRRSNRNRERDRSSLNQNRDSSSRMYRPHTNNLFQLDWHPVSDRLPTTQQQQQQQVQQKVAKYVNARPSSPPGSYDLTADFGAYNSHSSRLYPKVYKLEDLPPWLKTMPHPCDTRTQSPPAKPTNTDKMPDRVQVEGRLNQIREYIKVTSTMMDSLSQSGDPRAQAQHEKLSRMVEDLYDSEQKLSKLLEESQKYWRANENGELENGEVSQREHELRKKVEDSQRKLAQLQEHQAHLVGMQLRMREQLNEAREAQRAILDDTEDVNENGNVDNEEQQQPQQQCNVEQLERETETLRDKLQQLENKKRQMDNLVHELQACELSERASCSSDGGRPNGQQRDKLAELEAMKAQLQRLKSLMNCATHGRADSETEVELNDDDIVVVNQQQHHDDEAYGVMDESASNYGVNSIVNDDSGSGARSKRGGSSGPPPSVEQIQAVTRELKEQQQLLHSARAELQRLRQAQLAGQTIPSSSVASCSTTTTPPPLLVEKKQSNSSVASSKRRQQLEDLVKKDHGNGIGVNQNGAGEWGSRRGSNSQHSHVSTPGNLWPPPANPAVNASHDQTIDSISTAENLMEIGSQPPLENGFGNNFWGMPPVLANQPPQGAIVGSAEYYRQLLLGSQAQQLQLMNTTIQQCCQLLWSQQREMQSMRTAISQLQSQVRSQSRQGGLDQPHDDQQQHSNLGRAAVAAAAAAAAAAHYGSLEAATLPPSSSLPNLVSLPSSSPAPPATAGNCYPQPQPPPQQQQQLNNQVPPGNRANNYWDNFRSYSRQNLLSGSSKIATDCASGASVHTTQSANSASGVIPSHVNNKCNRQHLPEHHLHHHHMPPNGHVVVSSEAQYSLNLQQLERDSASAAPRNNYVPSSNDASPQPMPLPPQQQQQQQQLMMMAPAAENLIEEAAGGVAVMPKTDESCAKIAKAISEREDLRLILMHCLKVLESRKQNESPLPSSNISNSSDSSDDESEAGGQDNPTSSMPHIANVNASNAMPAAAAAAATADYVESSTPAQAYNSTSPQYLMEQSDYPDTTSIENAVISMPSVSSSTDGNNDDFEDHRLRQENSNNNHQSFGLNNEENANGEHLDDDFFPEAGAAAAVTGSPSSRTLDNSELSLDDFEDERGEFVMLDRSQNSPTSQWSPQQEQQYRRKRSRNCIVGSNIEHLQK